MSAAAIDLSFEREVTSLKELAIAMCQARKRVKFSWCFYNMAVDDGVGRRRKHDDDGEYPQPEYKKIRTSSPAKKEEVGDSATTVRDVPAAADARKSRSNALRRFNSATSPTPESLKDFISAAESAGATPDADDFDEKVIEQQLIALKAANARYVRKQQKKTNKQRSKHDIEQEAESEYKATYEDHFVSNFRPILIKNHIRYAVEDMKNQVRKKIKNRTHQFGRKNMDSLEKVLNDKIALWDGEWRRGSTTTVLKDFLKNRKILFKMIAKECPDYNVLADQAGDVSS
jgi:hypothetical protein